MDTVNVRQLKNNPSEALRSAVKGPVLVMKGDRPTAWILNLGVGGELNEPEVKLAVAVALFSDGALSLGRAARLAGIGAGEMISHLSRLGISIDRENQDVEADVETLEQWLASS